MCRKFCFHDFPLEITILSLKSSKFFACGAELDSQLTESRPLEINDSQLSEFPIKWVKVLARDLVANSQLSEFPNKWESTVVVKQIPSLREELQSHNDRVVQQQTHVNWTTRESPLFSPRQGMYAGSLVRGLRVTNISVRKSARLSETKYPALCWSPAYFLIAKHICF